MKTYIAALALSALPLAATAQTTPADVLADWQAMDTAYEFIEISYIITTDTPGLLRLEDFIVSGALDTSFGNFAFTANIGWAELRANGDGTVSFSEADTVVMVMTAATEMAGFSSRSDVRATMQMIGASTTISGAPGAHSYAGHYDELQMTTEQTDWIDGGEPIKSSNHQVHTGLDYTSTITGGVAGILDFAYSSERSTFTASTPVDSVVGNSTIETAAAVTGQQDHGRMSLAALTKSSLDLAALDITYASTIEALDLTMRGMGMDTQVGFGNSSADFTLNGQGAALALDISALNVSNETMGIPMNVSFDRFAIDLAGPLGPRHRIGTSRAALTIEGFVLNEGLMSMIDPSAVMGRGPLNLSLSVEGQTSALFDLANPVPADQMQPPEIRTFRFDAEGEYTDFNFTADGSGQMQDDMPVGTGQASVTNLQSMLERLASAGMISTFDMSLAQGMIAAMFTPGPAPGSLRSSFEMRADGSIWVNGAQMQ